MNTKQKLFVCRIIAAATLVTAVTATAAETPQAASETPARPVNKTARIELQVGQYWGYEFNFSDTAVTFEIHCTEKGQIPAEYQGPRTIAMVHGEKLDAVDRRGQRSEVYCIGRWAERVNPSTR